MTHEFIEILEQAQVHLERGERLVLASVVALDGSSYRRPGVRMLITENGSRTGAVSGGCVEKEVQRRSEVVFKNKRAKVITYDGRYRLGCEGVLYILLENFEPDKEQLKKLLDLLNDRKPLQLESYYQKEDEAQGNFGTLVKYKNESFCLLSPQLDSNLLSNTTVFKQKLNSQFKLVIIGGEHDAVKLCKMAALMGWQVVIITSLKDPKTGEDFPGAYRVKAESPETFIPDFGDGQTAVLLMTHNYAQDLQYLLKLQEVNLAYLGMLGSAKRRERLQEDLLEYASDPDFSFLERIYSPAGLNLGAETPEEIALSIVSEILAVTREKEPFSLKQISGHIHS